MTENRDAWKRRMFHEHYGFTAPSSAETVYDVGQAEEEPEHTFTTLEEWKKYVLERARNNE